MNSWYRLRIAPLPREREDDDSNWFYHSAWRIRIRKKNGFYMHFRYALRHLLASQTRFCDCHWREDLLKKIWHLDQRCTRSHGFSQHKKKRGMWSEKRTISGHQKTSELLDPPNIRKDVLFHRRKVQRDKKSFIWQEYTNFLQVLGSVMVATPVSLRCNSGTKRSAIL